MNLSKWTVPLLLRLLSLSGLTSASGTATDLRIGFLLAAPDPTPLLSQPRPTTQDVSLELDFFVQAANHELRVPIMPLHLLGKKSWNVYNQDNIQKVKRDEAAAKAIEDANEQRMQELDAERRMQILRGEIPTPLPEDEAKEERTSRESYVHGLGRERKKRKRAGENDTDFEMRIAHEHTTLSNIDKQVVLRKQIDAPLVDHSGHIDLFPQEQTKKRVEKNAEAEKEAAKKMREYEDQYTMRFSNAAGFKQGLENPWYSKSSGQRDLIEEAPSKDVWGNDDPGRKKREVARIVSSDPLAMMRQGAAQARQVAKERKRWQEDREHELRELEAEDRRAKRRRRRRSRDRSNDGDADELENFRLDDREPSSSQKRDHDSERRHRHKQRDSRRSSHRDDSRHRHRHRERYRGET
ncbi:hypothetical protein B0O99DRAFT_58399 [Bisporella sp. PMI_857]|nr:hypothetical protein B0O99DRAFT_58399 [Bisporella sp. PMI_857]